MLVDPHEFAYWKTVEDRGHQTRTLPNIDTRLQIYDRDVAVLPVSPLDLSLGAIIIRVQSVVDLLVLMYDHMWSVATPFFTTATEVDAPTGRTARVLELIANGIKDDRIARALDVGVRTVTREVSDLKTALGVSTRAEIVAAAVRRGWL
jgi:DNA-binding CsgD family transcriptional regulator